VHGDLSYKSHARISGRGARSMSDRAKRRNKAQRIGKEGELIFERWATRNRLIANKQTEDYGIDYHCQELAPVGRGSEEVTGRSVLVQVRATSGGSRARITLSREDAETAIRHGAPYCLVGVHMPTEQVSFKFLDEDLVETWSTFLNGATQNTSLRIDKMETDPAKFLEELQRVTRPAFLMRLALKKARIALGRELPGADFRLNSGVEGDWALVKLPQFGRAFHVHDERDQQALTGTVFRHAPADSLYDEALLRFALKPSIKRIADLTDGPVVLEVCLEESVTLTVRHASGEVKAGARLRHAADERAYLLECGLVLTVSDARCQSDGKYEHGVSFTVTTEGAAPLGTTNDLGFLKGLVRGATIHEFGRHPGIPVESFAIHGLAASVVAIEKVCDAIDMPLDDVKLADLTDRVFAFNLAFLEAMLVKESKPIPLPPFVVGLEPQERVKAEAWRDCFYKVPFVLRFKNRSLVLWLTGKGDAYVPDNVVQVFRFEPPNTVSIECAAFEVPGNGIAAAGVADGWPPISIDTQNTIEFHGPAQGFPVVGEYLYRSVGR
jgi:hypothetical protein